MGGIVLGELREGQSVSYKGKVLPLKHQRQILTVLVATSLQLQKLLFTVQLAIKIALTIASEIIITKLKGVL